MQGNLLIVDDDRQLATFLERFFAKHGYRATSVGSGAQARAILARRSFDLIVLDLILPDIDGLEIARELRREARTPIIMLTARDEVYDRIVGLEIGADDYLTKPYEPRELLARVKAVLRRSHPLDQGHEPGLPPARQLVFAGLALDLVARRLTHSSDGTAIALTGTEFALLRALAERAGEVLTRPAILRIVYGNAVSVTDRAIDAHIARLRRKLNDGDGGSSLIQTVHGEGYILATEVEAV